MRRLALGALVVLLLTTSAEARCVKSGRLRWSLGDVLTLNWTVQPGGICTFGAHGKKFAIFAIEIPTRPQHGVIGHEARYRIAYKANLGYRGPDSFVIRIVGKQNGMPGTVTINTSVTVR